MEEQLLPPTPEDKPKRTRLLTVLCILTFIGSGMNLFSGFMTAAFYDTFTSVAQAVAEKFKLPGMESLLESPPALFLTLGFFYSASLTGALMMWNLKKAGFHVYTIAQILIIIAPMYFLKMQGPSMPDLLLSGTFIIFYSINLKTMR